jgi:AmmeMemoRadiSam system protein B
MCGFIPVTITLLAARHLGATGVELVGYTDSGEASGDIDQVVGYAGLIIS